MRASLREAECSAVETDCGIIPTLSSELSFVRWIAVWIWVARVRIQRQPNPRHTPHQISVSLYERQDEDAAHLWRLAGRVGSLDWKFCSTAACQLALSCWLCPTNQPQQDLQPHTLLQWDTGSPPFRGWSLCSLTLIGEICDYRRNGTMWYLRLVSKRQFSIQWVLLRHSL